MNEKIKSVICVAFEVATCLVVTFCLWMYHTASEPLLRLFPII